LQAKSETEKADAQDFGAAAEENSSFLPEQKKL